MNKKNPPLNTKEGKNKAYFKSSHIYGIYHLYMLLMLNIMCKFLKLMVSRMVRIEPDMDQRLALVA